MLRNKSWAVKRRLMHSITAPIDVLIPFQVKSQKELFVPFQNGSSKIIMLKLGICGSESPHQIVVIVVAIVAGLGKQVARTLSGVPGLNLPSRVEPPAHEPPELLSGWQKRWVGKPDGVQTTIAILLQFEKRVCRPYAMATPVSTTVFGSDGSVLVQCLFRE